MSILNLKSAQLRQAASLKAKIEELQKKLVALGEFGGDAFTVRPTEIRVAKAAPAAKAAMVAKRKMSAAGIARIRAAQKARWAKVRAAAKSFK